MPAADRRECGFRRIGDGIALGLDRNRAWCGRYPLLGGFGLGWHAFDITGWP
ncbi:hypothetical protein KCH_17980 [Kitasatospora cheerisanensis KCTC 2395]|uniref:Uncharacterized protein n=1 Tax=Kitasatospora cheerisanensis KCTC 2395 TaxID=1348663 RepID=A0A066Z6L8_9ACTN|nr:hypothetical protein KCH_17980 [Kitasatospora cheerisanensis KCTC 2395]